MGIVLDIFKSLLQNASNIINKVAPDNHSNPVQSDALKSQEMEIEKPSWSHFVLNTKVTSPYGYRIITGKDGITKKQFHNGTDYTGHNTFAMAPCDCIIEKYLAPDYEYPYNYVYNNTLQKFVYTNPPNGRSWTPYIILRAIHDSGLKFIYRHGESTVGVGKTVKCGDSFYKINSYGFSQGSHLHVEVSYNEKELDPDAFIKEKLNVT